MIDGMLSGSIVAALFMLFQVFFLTRWVKSHENKKNKVLWTPFRKLLLDSIVQHEQSLMSISENYESNMSSLFKIIREKESLDIEQKNILYTIINETIDQLDNSRNIFYNKVQTVGQALQPYAAGYCNEVFWFGDVFHKSLNDSLKFLSEIDDEKLNDNLHTSQYLNAVWAKVESIGILKKHRFSSFKDNFVQSVWKEESMHYLNGEFLPPDDYARALDVEKAKLESRNFQKTIPTKSFFDIDD